MIPGLTAVGEVAVGALPDGMDLSEPNPLRALFAQPTAERCLLLVATVYDPSLGAERTVRISSRNFATAASDDPPLEPFDTRLERTYNARCEIPLDTVLPGAALPSFGEIGIVNSDGQVDNLAGYIWSGRRLELLAGLDTDPNQPLSQFGAILTGTAEQIVADTHRLTVQWRGLERLLQRPIQANLYAGTGGLEGDAELAGKPKPLAFGIARQVEPVLVDAVNRIYQYHDGEAEEVIVVRDRGVALTSDGDMADVTAWTPVAGHYVTDLARGLLRLGSKPDGKVTIDVKGDASGGYVETAAGIVRRVLEDRLGIDPGELELGTFAALDSETDAPCHLVAHLEPMDALSACKGPLESVGGYLTMTRLGRVRLQRWKLPSSPTVMLGPADVLVESFRQGGAPIPSWRRRFGAKRYHSTLTADELAASVSEADRADFGQEYRFPAASTNTEVQDLYGDVSPDVEVLTSLDDPDDAAAEQARQQEFLGEALRACEVTVIGRVAQFEVGDEVELALYWTDPEGETHDRYGLSFGEWFRISGWDDAGGSYADGDRVRLMLWGIGQPGYWVDENGDFVVDENGDAVSLS